MTREQKISLLDEAREQMVKAYNRFKETSASHALEQAGHFASVMSAVIADLD